MSYLFRIKLGKDEPLKEYLNHFDKAIMQVKSYSKDTLIQAFCEGIKNDKLIWAIAYDVPSTFAHLIGIAKKHANMEEYIKKRNSSAWEPSQPTGKNRKKKMVRTMSEQEPRRLLIKVRPQANQKP